MGLTGAEDGLKGYWSLEGLTAAGLVPDLTGHGSDGALVFDAHLTAGDSSLQ